MENKDCVQVIRCKDCEWYQEDIGLCKTYGGLFVFKPDDFCSNSELKYKEFSPEWFAREMQKIARTGGGELEHIEADELMCSLLRELSYGEGVDTFEKMGKWYS